jgi:hypothetical protein
VKQFKLILELQKSTTRQLQEELTSSAEVWEEKELEERLRKLKG